MPRPLARPARGVSLVELLVGMIIALMVLGIALQLMLIARARYYRLADEALIKDRGMQALELIGSAVHQAGWITDTPASSSARRWPDSGAPPSLSGRDNCSDSAVISAEDCRGSGVGNSDTLLIRFAGRSTQSDGADSDGATRDCAGYGVPERINGDSDPRPGRILLLVARNSTDREPELMCRSLVRNGNSPGQTHGLVRGVETLQLLYKLAPTASSPAVILSARTMKDEDWHRVQFIHVAIVVRGDRYAIDPPASSTITLFPELGSVPGVQTQDVEFRPSDSRRNRARFTTTVAVRNPLRCEVDAC